MFSLKLIGETHQQMLDFTRLTGPLLGQHHVIGSDICFWDNLVKPLKLLVNRALENGTKRIVITDPGRPPFYELCDHCQNTKSRAGMVCD